LNDANCDGTSKKGIYFIDFALDYHHTMPKNTHTLILIQYTGAFESRGYMDFNSVKEAMDALVKMYEMKLKELNPQVAHITYDVTDLFKFLDSMTDLCALVFDNKTNKYDPKDRNWVKETIVSHLRGAAGGGGGGRR
jgi:hypothetical protein